MSKIDLSKYGITGVTEIVHNPSYEQLFEEETKPGLQGFEKGQLTDMGAVNVMTGVYTGRSPKDKFFVMDDTTKDTIWWTSDEYKNDNKPLSQQSWKVLKEIADKQLSNKRLFVVDTFCGANENSRLKIRFIMEVAWQAHFVTNMFIRPTAEDAEIIEKNAALLDEMGFEVEPFGEESFAVRSVPDDVDVSEAASALEEICQKLREGGEVSAESARDEILHTVACKAAIKAGRRHDIAELERIACAVASGEVKYCPHGRPVSARLSKKQLDKFFSRIV